MWDKVALTAAIKFKVKALHDFVVHYNANRKAITSGAKITRHQFWKCSSWLSGPVLAGLFKNRNHQHSPWLMKNQIYLNAIFENMEQLEWINTDIMNNKQLVMIRSVISMIHMTSASNTIWTSGRRPSNNG